MSTSIKKVIRRDADIRSCENCKFNVPAEKKRQRDPRYGDGWEHYDLVITRKCLIDEEILENVNLTICDNHRRDGEPIVK